MCKAPLTLPDGSVVACHECSLCRARAIDDWAGRCTAEASTSSAAWAVDLTYGRDHLGESLHERAVVHTYSDVQKWLKLLRRHGYDVRYFVTGEYGEKFGRVHWHTLLFFNGPVPPLAGFHQKGHWVAGDKAVDQRFNHVRVDGNGEPVMVDGEIAYWWPHGFSYWVPFSYKKAQYAAKYIAKGIKGDGIEDAGRIVVTPKMSKKPPLGAAFFEQLAQRYVDAGLAPQDLFYRFPGVKQRKQDGSHVVKDFMVNDRSAELFLEHYVTAWRRTHPGRKMPPSALVANWVEFGVLRTPDPEADWTKYVEWAQEKREHRRGVAWFERPPKPRGMQLYSWMAGKVEFDMKVGAWRAPGASPGTFVWWVYISERGEYRWRRAINGNKRAS